MINNILIAEDDIEIANILSLYIEDENNKIYKAFDGKQALNIFNKEKIDLMLVDIMMPKIDGFSVIKKVRQTSNVPIIVISAKNMEEDKILGLNIGADDYIGKPFKALEVVARVNAQLRRFNKLGSNAKDDSKDILKIGGLTLDIQRIKLIKNDEEVDLTTVEFKILKLLMQNPNRVFTKAQIYENIFGEYFESYESTLMVHISNLRAKIEDDSKSPKYIKTVRGLGYKFEAKREHL